MAKFTFKFFKKLPAQEKKLTLSTMLTLVRIFLIPFILHAMICQQWGTALIVFMVAAITDALDGSLARLLNERTFLGACLDPIADKLLVLSCFFTLAFVRTPLFDIPAWFLLLIAVREVIMIGGSLFIWIKKGHLEIQPTGLGKVTTLVQMSCIAWLFACYYYHWLPIKTYYGMLGAVITLVVISLVQYLQIGSKQLST